MWHSGFFATALMALALLGFTGSETAQASYPASSEFSLNSPAGAPGLQESFKLAEAGSSAATPKNSPEKQKPPVKEDEGFFTKTLNSLIGDDKDKQADKASGDKDGKKEEDGFLTKTLKTLVGNEDDKDKKKTKKKSLNPLEVAPTVSATKKVKKDEPKTAISETKATLKDSFKKMVDVGSVKDKDGSAKKEKEGLLTKYLGGGDKKEKPAAGKPVKGTPKEKTKEAKKDEGGLFDSIIGGGDKKKDEPATKQVKVEKKVSPSKPQKITAKKSSGDEAKELEKDRGGTEKGKNVLKESFKSLLKKDAEKQE